VTSDVVSKKGERALKVLSQSKPKNLRVVSTSQKPRKGRHCGHPRARHCGHQLTHCGHSAP